MLGRYHSELYHSILYNIRHRNLLKTVGGAKVLCSAVYDIKHYEENNAQLVLTEGKLVKIVHNAVGMQ